ncbi:MFS general substrate transporter [Trichoderma evansii]
MSNIAPDNARLEAEDKAHISHVELPIDSTIDKKERQKLKWKLDLFVLPLISSVYFFASMDRSDLANAQIAGLEDELQLSPKDYSNASSMFLVSYVLFQLPGTLLIKKIRAPAQFCGAMLTWGILTVLTILVKSSGQLIAMRFLIGAAEAFVQGGAFYLSFWYEYHELATRAAIFFSTSTLAGAFNGLLSYGISKNLNGVNGWSAWKWIFLIEGILPVAFSFIVFAFLPASPSEVRYGFSDAEKEELMKRSKRSHNSSEVRVQPKKILELLKSIHFWLFTLLYCASLFTISSLSSFLPALVRGFGYSSVGAQLFTVIVYGCACLGILFFSRIADKTNARGLTVALSTAGAIAGYAMLIGLENRDARFAATCIIAFCMYPKIVLIITWAAMNFIGYTRR